MLRMQFEYKTEDSKKGRDIIIDTLKVLAAISTIVLTIFEIIIN